MVAALVLLALAGPPTDAVVLDHPFSMEAAGEAVLTLRASCDPCSWARAGQEAAVLRLEVDGRTVQHLPLTQGARGGEYQLVLGALPAGAHRLVLRRDASSAPGAGPVRVDYVSVGTFASGTREADVLAHAPFVYARKDAVGRFTDVPLLSWVEVDATSRGRRLRYSIVFSNEDGGTPPDRLMATWGRLTDVEMVYAVEVDAEGAVLEATVQGRDHKMLPFAGRREGLHPLLWVVTENNMVADRGETTVRHAPAPARANLRGRSREMVMDAAPWTYRVAAEEAEREGRIDPKATPGSKKVPDPRQFVVVEACGTFTDAVVTFEVSVAGEDGPPRWFASDGGSDRYRLGRRQDVQTLAWENTGCFRGAVAVPPGVGDADLRTLRLRVDTRRPGDGEDPLPPGTGSLALTHVNRVFRLDEQYRPGLDLATWRGDRVLRPGEPPLELPLSR